MLKSGEDKTHNSCDGICAESSVHEKQKDLCYFIRRHQWFCTLAWSSRFGWWRSWLRPWRSRWSRAWDQSLRMCHLPRFSLWLAAWPAALSAPPQWQLCTLLHRSPSSTSHAGKLHLLLHSATPAFQVLRARGTGDKLGDGFDWFMCKHYL